MKTLTIVLTDGPYISEYAEIASKLAEEALKQNQVNIFLYLDAVHIPKKPKPFIFNNVSELFTGLAEKGAIIEPVQDVLLHAATGRRGQYSERK